MSKYNWYKIYSFGAVVCLVVTFWLALFGGPWRFALVLASVFAVCVAIMEMGGVRRLRNFEANRDSLESMRRPNRSSTPADKSGSAAQISERTDEKKVEHPYPYDLFNEDNPRFFM